MKRLLSLLFFVYLFALQAPGQYVPDILGAPFGSRTIQMPADYDGEVVCTLVERSVSACEKAVLYIHGYSDYFFQIEMAEAFNRNGYDFYAVDLRKYGRSMLSHQTPFFVRDLREYFADIDSALAVIRGEGHTDIILAAHSTGGLTASLYMHDRRENPPARALLLNSPFFDWHLNWFTEHVAIPVISWLGRFWPKMVAQKATGVSLYNNSLHKDRQGEWSFDLSLKRGGEPMWAGWVRAIHTAQKELQKGLLINVPVLVMSSDASMFEGKEWNDEYHRHDIILDTKEIQKYARVIGGEVTVETFEGGKHDLVLSTLPVREKVYSSIFEWLDEQGL